MKYIVLGLVCSLLFAQDTTDEDELLALMELLNTPVVSTTKSAVSIQKAPGVVRVFSKDDIVKFGFGSLRELLHTILVFRLKNTELVTNLCGFVGFSNDTIIKHLF